VHVGPVTDDKDFKENIPDERAPAWAPQHGTKG
jgi:hypothetical protein